MTELSSDQTKIQVEINGLLLGTLARGREHSLISMPKHHLI